MSSIVTATIMNQAVTDLAVGMFAKGYTDLEATRTIYLSPRKHWVTSNAPVELQVIRGPETFLDQDGFLRNQFMLRIFAMRKLHLDAAERHSKALANISDSIYKLRDDILAVLRGKYLTGNLLVRPLLISSISEVEPSPVENDKNTLGLTMDFIGGINDAL